jgi:hypothetical protein
MQHRSPFALAVLVVAVAVTVGLFGPAASRDGSATLSTLDLTAAHGNPKPTKGPRPTATPRPSTNPTAAPTVVPTTNPSIGPTTAPTLLPTLLPSTNPTTNPTTVPTAVPTVQPTSNPTANPTVAPTAPPTAAPTANPTVAPTNNPAPCTIFPSTNVWNKRVDSLPVASNSTTMLTAIGLSTGLHPDFSSLAWNGGLGYGIPYNVVGSSTPTYPVDFYYPDESDPGPYPIPSNPKIEGGGDAHLLSWDTDDCMLYEIFDASKSGGAWFGGSGAIWDLRSNALRPDGWTSADAAGLPILPGLVRYSEVNGGAILHALRFTASRTCSNHIYPARHDAGSYSCSSYPPMGLRVRLKASVDISGYGPQAQVILTALQRYGMLLADNGSNWYISGAPNANWNDDDLHTLGGIKGSDFEVVDTSGLR